MKKPINGLKGKPTIFAENVIQKISELIGNTSFMIGNLIDFFKGKCVPLPPAIYGLKCSVV
jgi:hypothetical protein